MILSVDLQIIAYVSTHLLCFSKLRGVGITSVSCASKIFYWEIVI